MRVMDVERDSEREAGALMKFNDFPWFFCGVHSSPLALGRLVLSNIQCCLLSIRFTNAFVYSRLNLQADL